MRGTGGGGSEVRREGGEAGSESRRSHAKKFRAVLQTAVFGQRSDRIGFL